MGREAWRLLAVTFLTCALAGPALAAKPKVGEPAPDFHVTTLDGRELRLADLKGQVVVLNFWATWCGPCKRELPLLDGYYRLQKEHGLQVLAVTTEDSLPIYQLKPLAKLLSIPMVRHLSGPYADLGGLPTNYVIDRAGVLRYARAGAFTLDDLNDLLVPLLRESPAEPSTAPTEVSQAGPAP